MNEKLALLLTELWCCWCCSVLLNTSLVA